MAEEQKSCSSSTCGESSCSGCSQAAQESSGPQFKETLPSARVKKVIGIVSGKGGVGKSLVTSLLATRMNREGFKTAILDADATGPSIPRMLGIGGKLQASQDGIMPAVSETGIKVVSTNLILPEDTDPVIWRGPVIAGVITQFWGEVTWGDIDFMFVDMPPGTGDVPLTVFQSLPVDGIVIVASPQELVGMIVTKAVKMADKMGIPVLALVENMSYLTCPDCGKKIAVFGESHIDAIAEEYHIDTVAKIPMNPEFAAACDAGKVDTVLSVELDPIVDLLKEMI
ncbi:MAG: Mrp/NBP35 family ATP-binding protein [Actinobacteria bacterium]|nr:Mrp/NBP35 family ATP-binding protein [Actinomycetota bacterium]